MVVWDFFHQRYHTYNQGPEKKKQFPKEYTPEDKQWNIITEVWKIMFLSKWVISRFQPLIFQGVSAPGETRLLSQACPTGFAAVSKDSWSPVVVSAAGEVWLGKFHVGACWGR